MIRGKTFARLGILVSVVLIGIGGCTSSRAERDGGLDAPGDDGQVDATIAERADEEELRGTRGHCCADGILASCFCPAGAACAFGTACASGGCVEGDGSTCEAGSVDATDR